MNKVIIKNSYELSKTDKEELFSFLDKAFEGEFSRDDLSHALGGIHLMIKEDEKIIAHVSVVQRSMVVGKKAHYVGYVEAMAVSSKYQRQGIGQLMMEEVESIIKGTFDFGALCASEMGLPLYQKMGWIKWEGNIKEFSLSGIKESNEEILVFNTNEQISLKEDFICDLREGDCW